MQKDVREIINSMNQSLAHMEPDGEVIFVSNNKKAVLVTKDKDFLKIEELNNILI